MDVSINIWAVIAATVASMIVGSVWYSQKTFGKIWIKLARIDMSNDRGSVVKPAAIAGLVTLVTAYVLAYMTFLTNQYFSHSYVQDALMTAFWLWLGLTATRVINHDVFEGRPAKLMALTIGHEFVSTILMGLIIGLFGV